MFRKPSQQTLKADHTSRVSRCAVCLRRRVTEPNYGRTLKPFTSNGQKEPVSRIQYAPQPRYPEYPYQRQPPQNRGRNPNRRVPHHYRRRGRVHKQERPTEIDPGSGLKNRRRRTVVNDAQGSSDSMYIYIYMYNDIRTSLLDKLSRFYFVA